MPREACTNLLPSADSLLRVLRLLVVLSLWPLEYVSILFMTYQPGPPTESLLSQLILDLPSLHRIDNV